MVKKEFRLEQLFGSKTRARLLGLFLQNPDEAYFVRELTRKIGAQLNSVRRELKNLQEIGLVEEQENKDKKKGKALSEKKKFYTAKKSFVLFEDLRSLFSKVEILLKNSLVQEIDDKGDIHFFAFTGVFVDAADVPTDLMIVGSIDQKALQKVVAKFEEEMSHEINYTLMPKDEFLYRHQVSDRFLHSILDAKKVVVINRLNI
jgi:predicted transcriptional regulator